MYGSIYYSEILDKIIIIRFIKYSQHENKITIDEGYIPFWGREEQAEINFLITKGYNLIGYL